MKKVLSILIFFFSSFFLFAKPGDNMDNMYEKAPQSVQQAIQKCDSLIKESKYASAYRALSVAEDLGKDADYLIYKRTEVITTWFSYSMMHQMFDILDFNSADELYEYRYNISHGTEDMTFKFSFMNPEDWFKDYEEEYGSTPRINLAKAQYYFDVSQRYGNQWLKSYDELLQLAYENYKAAIAGDFYDIVALVNYSEAALFSRHFEDAYNGYLEIVQYIPDNGLFWYNLTSSSMYLQRYEEAITYAKNAIKYPEKDVSNQIDAYLILSDAYEYSGDSANAESTLIQAIEKYPAQPYPIYTLGQLYYGHNKISNALDTFMDCITCEYTNYNNSSVISSIIQYLFSQGDLDSCFTVLNRVEPLVTENNTVLSQLYYLRSQLYALTNNNSEALNCLKKSEDYAITANDTNMLNELEYYKQSMNLY